MNEGDDAVDRAHLERLGARFGAPFLVQMIDLFLAQGRERIEAARLALDAGDAEGITSAAHALKSSAGNLGATSLMACAAEAERVGRGDASTKELAPHVDTLAKELERARTILLELRRGLPA